ncbi:MAG: hypothetical protein GY909_17855 [Oligoflexia bacterium]|nr:hypothetical protein [Oligoflexia bacterium]
MNKQLSRLFGECLLTMGCAIWFHNTQEWEPAIVGSISFITLILDTFVLEGNIEAQPPQVEDNPVHEVHPLDIELYERMIDFLPHNNNMEHWLREHDMGGRGTSFDYFDRVFDFYNEFSLQTIFFRNNELENLKTELLNSINDFRWNCAQHMVPDNIQGNFYLIPRHEDRRPFDPQLEAQEIRNSEELNQNATDVYNNFLSLYCRAQEVLY